MVLKLSLVIGCLFIGIAAVWAKNGIDAATNRPLT